MNPKNPSPSLAIFFKAKKINEYKNDIDHNSDYNDCYAIFFKNLVFYYALKFIVHPYF
jgi:hypothetical protein